MLCIYFFMALLTAVPSFSINADTRYFESNETGMALSPISGNEKTKYPYYLEITSQLKTDSRKLINDGKPIKRWETSYYQNGNPKETSEYKNEKLSLKTVYDEKYRIIKEETYADGALTFSTSFTYSLSGKRYASETKDSADVILYTEEYSLTDGGMLREIKKTWPDHRYQVTSFLYSRHKLFREVESSNSNMAIERYNSEGKVNSVEVWNGSSLVREDKNTFDSSSGTIASSDISDKTANTIVKENYDSRGHIIRETTELAGKVIEDNEYSYNDDGKRVRAIRKSASGLEEWIYTYGDNGDLLQEDYFLRGQLEKRVRYADSSTYQEEIYDSGSLIVIAYFEKQDKVKEEYYEKGKLVRTRQIKK
jgi:antitoxin component YwqK of YwqJK toxin-antitoxin module